MSKETFEGDMQNEIHQTKRKRYRATRGGCVIETVRGGVVYDPVDGVSAKAIAVAMNWYWAQGVEADWKLVEKRLVELGVLKECRA